MAQSARASLVGELRSLGPRIEKAWARLGHAPHRLPAIACEALRQLDVDGTFDTTDLYDWTLRTTEFAPHYNPFPDSGPPAFTVWSSRSLFVNLYFYLTPQVLIHDHNFFGAFRNLQGSSLHAMYGYQHRSQPGGGVRLGELALGDTALLSPADVHPIVTGNRYIHQVWHLDRPTIVLVVRTWPLERVREQCQYLKPGLALQLYRPELPGPLLPLHFRKRRQMLGLLKTTRPDLTRDYLILLASRKGDSWSAATHVLDNWAFIERGGFASELLSRSRKAHGSWVDVLPRVAEGVRAYRQLHWPALIDPGHRLLASLLFTFTRPAAIRDWIARIHPTEDAGELTARWLGEMSRAGTILPPLASADLDALKQLLAEPRRSPPGTKPRLRKALSGSVLSPLVG